MLRLDDTIAAVATATGAGARGIIRLSGPAALDIASRVFQVDEATSGSSLDMRARVQSGGIALQSLRMDTLAWLWSWPAGASFTRQPCCELHTLGSAVLQSQILERLCHHGARLAQPGEFTLRAFVNGRIDLTQAEAVIGTVHATTRSQFDAAIQQLAGGLSNSLHAIRDTALDLVADVEAGLDFAAEDIRFIEREELSRRLTLLAGQFAELRQQVRSRETQREVPRVVLVGQPNVGKSSLFNRLTQSGVALVDGSSGTTRDYLTARIDLDGVECDLIDTAGFEPARKSNSIASSAQQQTSQQQLDAQVILHCVDVADRDGAPSVRAANTAPLEGIDGQRCLIVWTKCDQSSLNSPTSNELFSGANEIRTSAHAETGITELRTRLRQLLGDDRHDDATSMSTFQRCHDAMDRAQRALESAISLCQDDQTQELIALELRELLACLGTVLGTVYTEDVLDRVFARFCIGK